MRYLTKIKTDDLPSFFEGMTISPVMDGDRITMLELKQGDRAMQITKADAYSPNISCHIVEDGRFADKFVLSAPNGTLVFDCEDEAINARVALALTVEQAPITTKRVRLD